MILLTLSYIQQVRRLFRRVRNHPENLVRLCKNREEFIQIINEAVSSLDRNWEDQLVDRVLEYILDGESSGISVYRADICDPLDHGHAIAVIAEGIGQDNFIKKKKFHCTRGTLLIPTACLPKTTSYKFTPRNNQNFYPANNYHFDLSISDPKELAIALLNGINQGVIAWSFLGNEKTIEGSYLSQAAIAYSYCLKIFGKLTSSEPPSIWADGKTLNASQQIDVFQSLAKINSSNSFLKEKTK